MEKELEALLNDYLNDFNRKKQSDIAVKNSIPIVWFGDLKAYQKSELKIVTVGLNPSLKEFPAPQSPRFDTKANNADALYKTLNDYFYKNPYKSWFAQFEKCLNRLNASFGGKMSDMCFTNTAISLDAYSSIATNPTWGRLTEKQQAEVNQQHLFQSLLEYLQPDVILMSVAHDCFIDTLHISKPIRVFYEHRKVEVYKENGRIMIYGRNMKGQPFGGIATEILDNAFAKVRNTL